MGPKREAQIKTVARHEPGGLTADTEVLTRQGWRSGADLRRDEDVATFDATRNLYKFDRVSSIAVRLHDGPLVNIRGRPLDLGLTPTHPLLAKSIPKRGSRVGWRYEVAGELPKA